CPAVSRFNSAWSRMYSRTIRTKLRKAGVMPGRPWRLLAVLTCQPSRLLIARSQRTSFGLRRRNGRRARHHGGCACRAGTGHAHQAFTPAWARARLSLRAVLGLHVFGGEFVKRRRFLLD